VLFFFTFLAYAIMTDTAQPGAFAPSEKHIHEVLDKVRARLPNWDGGSWNDWAPHECAEAVRAIARDYLDNYGFGTDWHEAAKHAEFVLTAAFNDIVSVIYAGQTPSRAHDMYVRISPAGQDEAFEILLTRPTEFLIPPVPSMGGSGVDPEHTHTSLSAQASGRIPARFDATQITDEPILQALDVLAGYLNNKDRICLMMVAAMLVRWRGCQVSQVIQGGVTYRKITNPNLPAQAPGDARLLYARVGNRMQQALVSQGPMANVVLMV
jgi:hypothetical protein